MAFERKAKHGNKTNKPNILQLSAAAILEADNLSMRKRANAGDA